MEQHRLLDVLLKDKGGVFVRLLLEKLVDMLGHQQALVVQGYLAALVCVFAGFQDPDGAVDALGRQRFVYVLLRQDELKGH